MKLDFDFDKKREFEVTEGKHVRFRLRDIAVEPGKKVSLRKDFDPDFTGGFKDKSDALERLGDNTARVAELQEILYAQDTILHPHDLPGNGCGRQGRCHSPCDVGSEPAGLSCHKLQGAFC